MLFQKIVEAEQLDELQGEPGAAEGFFVLDANAVDIDFDPFGLRFAVVEEFCLNPIGLVFVFGGLLDAFPFGFFQLTEIGDDPLTRALGRSVRFDQSPVRELFPFRFFVAWSDEHAGILSRKKRLVKKSFLHYIAF